MAEMTEKEARSQFNQISNAIRNNDVEKLSAIMDKEVSEEETPSEPTPAEVVEETKPELEEAKEETPAPLEEAETVEPKEEAPSELDKLRDQLEKVSKENHSLRSQAGRVPHVQRKLQELDKKLEEIEKQRTSPLSQPSSKTQPKVVELLKGIKETDPDLADAIAAAIAEATNGVAEEIHAAKRDNIQLIRQNEVASYQEAEASRLLQMYPNAPEVFTSPSWTEWKKEQSSGIVNLATSDNADEVAYAFKKYAEDMVIRYPELAKSEDKKAEPTAVVKDEPSEKAQQVEAERQRKKATSVTIGSANAPGKVGMPDDPDALFKKISEEIRKTITG